MNNDEPKPDEGRLLTDEVIEQVLMIAQRQKWEHRVHPRFEVEKELLEAQRDLTASIRDADCQEVVVGILDEIAEDFVAVVGNLYMTDENMTLAFELWGQVKKQALKKGVK